MTGYDPQMMAALLRGGGGGFPMLGRSAADVNPAEWYLGQSAFGSQVPSTNVGAAIANVANKLAGAWMMRSAMDQANQERSGLANELNTYAGIAMGRPAEAKTYGDGTTIDWNAEAPNPSAAAQYLAGSSNPSAQAIGAQAMMNQVGMQQQMANQLALKRYEQAMAPPTQVKYFDPNSGHEQVGMQHYDPKSGGYVITPLGGPQNPLFFPGDQGAPGQSPATPVAPGAQWPGSQLPTLPGGIAVAPTAPGAGMATPGAPVTSVGGPSYVAKTVGIEDATGDPNARNGNVAGLGQFKPGTWIDLVTKYHPEMLQGAKSFYDLAPAQQIQIMDARTDPKLAPEMIARYAQDNQAKLQAAKVPVTDATLYLAHFLGPTGAIRVLKADPSTPLNKVVSPAAMAANPGMLANRSVGDLMAWANYKFSQPASTAVASAPLPPGPRDFRPTMQQPGGSQATAQPGQPGQPNAEGVVVPDPSEWGPAGASSSRPPTAPVVQPSTAPVAQLPTAPVAQQPPQQSPTTAAPQQLPPGSRPSDWVTGYNAQGKPVIDRNRVTGDIRPHIDQTTVEDRLRGQFQDNPQVKDFHEAAINYSSILNAAKDDTPTGDISLIYAFGKMFAPGAVVRQTEANKLEVQGSIPAQMWGYVRAFNGYGRLTPQMRAQLVGEATNFLTSRQRTYDATADTFRKAAIDRGVDPQNIIPNIQIPQGARQQGQAGAGTVIGSNAAPPAPLPPGRWIMR